MEYKFPNTPEQRRTKVLELDIDLLVENLKNIALLYRSLRQEYLKTIEATILAQVTKEDKEAKKSIEKNLWKIRKFYFLEFWQLKKTFEKMMKGK